MKLAFLASNNGSGLRAIIGAIEAGRLAAEPRLVVSNRRQAPALDFARAHGVPVLYAPTTPDPEGADEMLARALAGSGADLVVLSGYLRKLGPRTLAAFRTRILNVHPALLPQHGGPGMYGRRVHEAVLAGGAKVTGATVHLVDEIYDHGPILAQVEVAVSPEDTPASLEARVTAAEPVLLLETLGRIASGNLTLEDRPRTTGEA